MDQVSIGLVEPKGIHNGGQEVLEGLCDDEEEVDGRKHPGEGISDGLSNAAPVAALIIFADTTSRYVSTVLSHSALFGGEEVCTGVTGPVGKEPESKESYGDADGALNDEEPLPSVQPSDIVHVGQDSSGQEA